MKIFLAMCSFDDNADDVTPDSFSIRDGSSGRVLHVPIHEIKGQSQHCLNELSRVVKQFVAVCDKTGR